MERPDATSQRNNGLRFVIQAVVAVLVSILALWWVFKETDISEMQENLAKSSIWTVVVFGLGQLFFHIFRIVRWGMYIRPLGPEVSNRAIFAAANIGIASTFFLPFRLGEFIRPTLINRAGVRFGAAVASIVVERIADGLCSVGMFFIFFSFVPESSPIPAELTQLSTGAAIAFGGGLVFLILAAVWRGPVLGLTKLILERISPSLAERVVGLISTFLDGLAALGSPWRAFLYIALTIGYWSGSGLLIWLLAANYQPELPVVSGLFTISVLVFAVMIPAGPAFAGTFELGFKFGFGAFGLDPSSIIVIAVIAHVVQLLSMGIFLCAGIIAAEPNQSLGGLHSKTQVPTEAHS